MSERPLAVTAVCLLGALGFLYAAFLLLDTGMWAVHPTFGERATALAALVVAAVSLYGMWRMRRWGVVLLGAALVARAGYGLLARQPWNAAALAGPAVALLVGLVYVRRMS